MKIKNLNHTTGKACSCGSWLKHWENVTGQMSIFCGNGACFNIAEVGGHVKKSGGNDGSHYIVPLCKTCNSSSFTDEFTLRKDYNLASAGSDSCIKEDVTL
ncbi:hypothetical protein [Pectobacterium brasiliense]|uniref:hypothetical protein n=1 Tax=Pectobacterium brasiliense TaxID=180957 RepID=UPI0010390FFF|nr:hypothetical protein [Pectobacterium brasiliense]